MAIPSRARLPSRQRGAVLYIALIMLILLALIGIVGMQVTGLQERMAGNYFSANLAFQAAELSVREAECFVEATVNRTATTCAAQPIDQNCDTGFDAHAWAQARSLATPAVDRVNIRAIGRCIAGNASLAMGGELDEDPNPVFQVTAYGTDRNADPGADAAVDTIFRP